MDRKENSVTPEITISPSDLQQIISTAVDSALSQYQPIDQKQLEQLLQMVSAKERLKITFGFVPEWTVRCMMTETGEPCSRQTFLNYKKQYGLTAYKFGTYKWYKITDILKVLVIEKPNALKKTA